MDWDTDVVKLTVPQSELLGLPLWAPPELETLLLRVELWLCDSEDVMDALSEAERECEPELVWAPEVVRLAEVQAEIEGLGLPGPVQLLLGLPEALLLAELQPDMLLLTQELWL